MDDDDRLSRFVEAQHAVYARVVGELRSGRKTSHWMWFVFPQIDGLGSSPMARRYAIGSLREAEAYLRHDLLGSRLLACTTIVNGLVGHSARAIFGQPDDMKFCSCMTLFGLVQRDGPFVDALHKYFGGEPDTATLARLV